MAAAEFSFLMSIAAIAGAAVWTLPELLASPPGHLGVLGIGAAVALVAGIGAIWFCIRLLRRGSLHWFAYYTWAAGLAMLAWLHFHGGTRSGACKRSAQRGEAERRPGAAGYARGVTRCYGSRIGCRLCAGTVSRSFFSARASSWRTRSRDRPSDCPICSSVCSSSPPRP